MQLKYRIAGKFGGDLNLALWRSGSRSSILNPPTLITGHNACFQMCTATDKRQIKISPTLFMPIIYGSSAKYNDRQYFV